MQVAVAAPFNYTEPVTVQLGYYEDGEFVLEECDHAGAYEDELDYGHACYYHADWHDDIRPTMVCDKDNCDWSELIEPEEPDYE